MGIFLFDSLNSYCFSRGAGTHVLTTFKHVLSMCGPALSIRVSCSQDTASPGREMVTAERNQGRWEPRGASDSLSSAYRHVIMCAGVCEEHGHRRTDTAHVYTSEYGHCVHTL